MPTRVKTRAHEDQIYVDQASPSRIYALFYEGHLFELRFAQGVWAFRDPGGLPLKTGAEDDWGHAQHISGAINRGHHVYQFSSRRELYEWAAEQHSWTRT